MSIVASLVVPNSPLVIPSIVKDRQEDINKTIDSFNKLEKILYTSCPDTLIILSAHDNLEESSLSLNVSDPHPEKKITELKADFKEFGDFATQISCESDFELLSLIRQVPTDTIPVKLYNAPLDYRYAVPLYYFKKNMPDVKVISLGYALNETKKHFDFGKELHNICEKTSKKIALIAAGSLSHSHTKEAPAGFSENAKKVDTKIRKALKNNSEKTLLNIDMEMRDNVHETIISPLLIMQGALNQCNKTFNELSYEYPFGVGYLTGYYTIG